MSMTMWQGTRYRQGMRGGHYESWFLRANHPKKAEAFWIRYTLLVPQATDLPALGELWVVYTQAELQVIRVAKSVYPLQEGRYAENYLDIELGGSYLRSGVAKGQAQGPDDVQWDLRYEGSTMPVLLLPKHWYNSGFPRAKSVTTRPVVSFIGTLQVNGAVIPINHWIGSENHNWGSRHTDKYAWAQVVGFDNDPEVFFEIIAARVQWRSFLTPVMTLLVLRVDGQEIRLNGMLQALRANSHWKPLAWFFKSSGKGVRVRGVISAQPHECVALRYANPPGGEHICFNSKVAACDLWLERAGRPPRHLVTQGRAAFEILGDDPVEGMPVMA
ncbi:MAG: hypothetical protein HKM02_10670 [Pseudomonadales bacterium]|nr:hypothetical protein [Pseudomonadales bacterium]